MNKKLLDYKSGVLAYTLSMATLIGFSILLTVLGQNGIQTQQGVNFWLFNGAYSICLGVVALLVLVFTKQPIKQSLGLDKKPFSIVQLLVLLGVVFVLLNLSVVVNNWFLQFLQSLGLDVKTSSVTSQQILENPVLAIIVACILPAINEELIFRGLVVKGIRQKLGTVASILLTGFLFALFHGNPAQTLHQFILGCVLSYVALSTQSVVLPVLAHFFNNLSAVFLALFVEPTNFYLTNQWLIVGVGIALLGILGYVGYRQFKLPALQTEKENTSPFDLLLVATTAFCMYMWTGVL